MAIRSVSTLSIPEWEWEVSMDIVDGSLHSSKGNDNIWAVIDRQTKSSHFVPMPSSRSTKYLAKVYI